MGYQLKARWIHLRDQQDPKISVMYLKNAKIQAVLVIEYIM